MPKRLTKEEFIMKSNNIHKNIFDYSLVDYFNGKTKIKIVCPIHGVFEQRPNDHLTGYGCKKCQYKKISKLNRFTNVEFVVKARKIHGNKYDYSKCDYDGYENKINIICPTHNIFTQTPHNHLRGHGCPKCNESKGEKSIRLFLEEHNIPYESEKSFKYCKDNALLRFDFYLPEQNMLIEFDGMQHYNAIDFFGGVMALKLNKKHDKIKNRYVIENGLKLLRLPEILINYDELVPTLKHYLLS
jgi:hypothetical protein